MSSPNVYLGWNSCKHTLATPTDCRPFVLLQSRAEYAQFGPHVTVPLQATGKGKDPVIKIIALPFGLYNYSEGDTLFVKFELTLGHCNVPLYNPHSNPKSDKASTIPPLFFALSLKNDFSEKSSWSLIQSDAYIEGQLPIVLSSPIPTLYVAIKCGTAPKLHFRALPRSDYAIDYARVVVRLFQTVQLAQNENAVQGQYVPVPICVGAGSAVLWIGFRGGISRALRNHAEMALPRSIRSGLKGSRIASRHVPPLEIGKTAVVTRGLPLNKLIQPEACDLSLLRTDRKNGEASRAHRDHQERAPADGGDLERKQRKRRRHIVEEGDESGRRNRKKPRLEIRQDEGNGQSELSAAVSLLSILPSASASGDPTIAFAVQELTEYICDKARQESDIVAITIPDMIHKSSIHFMCVAMSAAAENEIDSGKPFRVRVGLSILELTPIPIVLPHISRRFRHLVPSETDPLLVNQLYLINLSI